MHDRQEIRDATDRKRETREMLTGRLRQRVSRCVACVRVVPCAAHPREHNEAGSLLPEPSVPDQSPLPTRPLSPTNQRIHRGSREKNTEPENKMNKKCGEVVDIHEGQQRQLGFKSQFRLAFRVGQINPQSPRPQGEEGRGPQGEDPPQYGEGVLPRGGGGADCAVTHVSLVICMHACS